MAVYSASELVEVRLAGVWIDISSAVVDVSGELQLTSNRDNCFSFGDNSEARCDLEIFAGALAAVPDLMPVRVTYTRDTSTRTAFVGLVSEHSRDAAAGTRQLSCIGLAEFMRTTKPYSPLFYRTPVATMTSVSSVEDPSSGSYNAGIINWLLWTSGGRPIEQDFNYPNAVFYYTCETAIIVPDWTWTAGESAWDGALKAARASGGQLYQRRDGVIAYKQPLSFADGTGVYAFTTSIYKNITERTPQGSVMTQVICPYLPRYVHPLQEIVNDTTIHPVQVGQTVTLPPYDPQWPLYSVEQSEPGKLIVDGINAAIKATFYDGRTVRATWSEEGGTVHHDFTHSVVISAQRITVTITNTSATPFYVTKIVIRGQPVAAGEAGSITVGTGTAQRNIEDNPFIQSPTHADRLARLTLAFYGTSRPVRTLTVPSHDPVRFVTETVTVDAPDASWWTGSMRHLIVAKHIEKNGTQAEYDVVPLSGLPATSDYYLVGDTDYAGQTKRLGF